MKLNDALLILFLLAGMYASIRAKKLTIAAAITGGVLGWFIYIGAGFTGIAMLAAFFIMGTGATMWQIKTKETFLIAEKDRGKRKMSQVLANAGVAAIAGMLCFFFPKNTTLFCLLMASSFSSATADTLSSELGNVYGKRFYNILTCKSDMRGLDGVISVEGTLSGFSGSIIIAIIYILGFGWNTSFFVIIIIAGTVGNLSDSLLGAAFERKKYIGNDIVNFLNTLLAAVTALLLYTLLW